MPGCLLFKKPKKINESCSLSKAGRMSSTYLKLTIPSQKINHSIVFLDVFICGINNQNLTLQIYHRSTYTSFFLSFKSFISFLIRLVSLNV